MFKIVSVMGAVVLSLPLFAAPVGNTAAPKIIERGIFFYRDRWMDLRVGYEGDFVTDGRVKQFDQGAGRVDSYKQNTNSGTVTLNFLNRIDLYGVLGGSETSADWRIESASSGTVQRAELNTNTALLWGIGGRAILEEWRNVSLGCGGRYSYVHSTPSQLNLDGIVESTTGAFFHWNEWQVNVDISYKIHFFTPYVGTKYSHAITEMGGFSVPIAADGEGANSFKNRNPVGFYLGCTLSSGNYFMLNLEGRLIDEESITVSGDFRF